MTNRTMLMIWVFALTVITVPVMNTAMGADAKENELQVVSGTLLKLDLKNHRGLLTNEQMAGVRWSIRQLCCSRVLVATNRMFARVTASQMASASAASFFCRLT